MTRRYVSAPDADRVIDTHWRVVEQFEQDDLYSEIGFALDLVETAEHEARRQDLDLDDETRRSLAEAEQALWDALRSRAETFEEEVDVPEEIDA